MTWNSLLNCLSGQATAAEQHACQDWLRAHPDNRALYQRLEAEYARRQAPVPAAEQAEAWARLQARLTPEPTVALPAPIGWRPWARLAAAVLVLAVATALLILSRPVFFPPAPAAWTTVRATEQRRLVRLPDSSRVWLARHSALSYPADFGCRTRPVRLRGAAFFEVQKNPARPFMVHTGRVAVRVVGTSFEVRARPDGPAEVAVATGVVSVQAGTTQLRLLPGQQLSYSPAGRATLTPTSLAAARALRSDTLHFERSTLPQIARQLSTRYGLPVQLAPGDTARLAFSGRIADAGLPRVLEGLSFATNHRFRLTARRTIVIQPN